MNATVALAAKWVVPFKATFGMLTLKLLHASAEPFAAVAGDVSASVASTKSRRECMAMESIQNSESGRARYCLHVGKDNVSVL